MLEPTPDTREAPDEPDSIISVGAQIRHSIDTDGVELIDADDELIIQHQCPVAWAGCQTIIDTHLGDIEIND